MGIVVCLVLLLGALSLLPQPFKVDRSTVIGDSLVPSRMKLPVSLIAALVGLWNIFWYWIQFPNTFWGITALTTGLLLVVTSLLLFAERASPDSTLISLARVFGRLRPILFLGLMAGFLLYAITIIQLNLGMPIIGR